MSVLQEMRELAGIDEKTVKRMEDRNARARKVDDLRQHRLERREKQEEKHDPLTAGLLNSARYQVDAIRRMVDDLLIVTGELSATATGGEMLNDKALGLKNQINSLVSCVGVLRDPDEDAVSL